MALSRALAAEYAKTHILARLEIENSMCFAEMGLSISKPHMRIGIIIFQTDVMVAIRRRKIETDWNSFVGSLLMQMPASTHPPILH
jgi:hypothetical protein